MAKTTKRARAKFTIPVAIVAGMMPGVMKAWNDSNKGQDWSYFGRSLAYSYTGVNTFNNNKIEMAGLKTGLIPLILGFIVHKAANIAGINRALSKVPFIRI